MAIDVETAKKITNQFCQDYPNLTKRLGFLFREQQSEVYGHYLTEPVKGSLSFKTRTLDDGKIIHATISAVLNHADSAEDFKQTLNHEILGHYALNAVEPIRKRLVLSQLKMTQNDPKFRDLWDSVNRLYKEAPLDIRAEEVYCSNAEKLTPQMLQDRDKVHKLGAQSYRETCLNNSRPFNREDLTNITLWHTAQVMELNKNLQPLAGIQEVSKNTQLKEFIR